MAVLQYRWIGEVSQADRRQREDSLNRLAAQFAQDFDRELTRLITPFQVRASLDTPNLAIWLSQRFDELSRTYPGIIQKIFVVRTATSGMELLQFDPATATLATSEWPENIQPLRENLATRLDRSPERRPPPQWDSLSTENPVIPIPVIPDALQRREESRRGGPPPPPQPPGWTIVQFDRRILFNELIPAVVTRHFGANNAEYRIAIVSRDPNPHLIFGDADLQDPDLRIPLSFFPEQGRGRGAGGPAPQFQRGQRSPPGMFGGVRGGPPMFRMWDLLVKHRAGSLDAAIESVRRRNLVVSFGILLLLASSVVMMVLLSYRTRALAQLQMDFVARVSHELRTPLAIIRSAAYNVAHGVVSDDRDIREYAAMVQKEGERLSTMVDQILTFSRTDSGKATYDIRPLQVEEVVDRVVTSMSPAVGEAGCEIDWNVARNLPKVRADERALTECLQNLLSNAIKYGRNGSHSRIRIEARRADSNTVVITIADSGPGIAAADLPHIFEPFFRGRNARSDTPGSGLGLNLVKRLMSAQGGHVTVESEPGNGTRFTLHLNAVHEAAS